MYAKLIGRNIRRSLRDYGLYFLTLVFAVAIFYVFNSLADQPGLLTLQESTRRMAEGAATALEWLTLIMTGIVALLVLYANRVIITKRNRELGTYLLLGMEQGRLSFLLLAEIIVIGTAAMAVGLVAGIFLSQFFALLVARLFHAELTGHPFVFSASAIARTLIAYGLTFVAVGLWQVASVYRQKLLDLITGARPNEELNLRSRPVSALLGLLSLGALGYAYWLADQVSRDSGVQPTDPRIATGAILGVVGTYLLFAALAGLLTSIRRGQKGWMGHGLNRFLYRQVTSKIATHTTMLATIALMLTFTICAMGFGLGLGRGLTERAELEAPFDYLLMSTAPDEDFAWAYQALAQHNPTGLRTARFQTGTTEIRGGDLMLPEDAAWFRGEGVGELLLDASANIMSASAYAELRAIRGYDPVALPDGTFLIHASAQETVHARRAREAHGRFLATNTPLEIAGHVLQPSGTVLYSEPISTWLAGQAPVLVVPDKVAAMTTGTHYLVVEMEGETPESLDLAMVSPVLNGAFRHTLTRSQVVGQSFVIEGMLLFITGYVGIMFILISATLLALQQVTDAVEHRQRFDTLRKLGADDPMIDGAIARQVGLYFLTPVAVALVHSLVAMIALARLFESGAGYTTVWGATLVTLALFVVIYGAYYGLSLATCRTLFKEAQAG